MQDVGERAGQGDGIGDTEVHALAAGGAVHMGGVAGQQQSTGPVAVGDAVVDPEPRSPQQLGDRCLARPEGPGVQQRLHECRRRHLRCVRGRRDDAEDVVGQRRQHVQAFLGVEQDHLVAGRLAGHPNVGEREGFGEFASGETDSGLFANGAVHAVGSDDVARP